VWQSKIPFCAPFWICNPLDYNVTFDIQLTIFLFYATILLYQGDRRGRAFVVRILEWEPFDERERTRVGIMPGSKRSDGRRGLAHLIENFS
jgi:hypothetical protein